MEYKASRTSTMDKVMMVKDLYGMVDHLEELLKFAESEEEIEELATRIKQATSLRREVTGSISGDKNYACAFKHAAGVWKASEEVWLADNDSESFARYREATDLFYWVAEKYIGEELSKCERCEREQGPAGDTGPVSEPGALHSISEMRSTIGRI